LWYCFRFYVFHDELVEVFFSLLNSPLHSLIEQQQPCKNFFVTSLTCTEIIALTFYAPFPTELYELLSAKERKW